MHFNLHKTFSTPHGGGGPGSGPVAVKKFLEPFLPVPIVVKEKDGRFRREWARAQTIGKLHGYFGNFGVLVRAYTYIARLGREGIKQTAQGAVLNANYLAARIEAKYPMPYGRGMHECVATGTVFKPFGVKTLDIAKRLLEFGFHAPTIYFPLIVPEALMIEPTETETKEDLDRFADALLQIADEAETDPPAIHQAPVDRAAGGSGRGLRGESPGRHVRRRRHTGRAAGVGEARRRPQYAGGRRVFGDARRRRTSRFAGCSAGHPARGPAPTRRGRPAQFYGIGAGGGPRRAAVVPLGLSQGSALTGHPVDLRGCARGSCATRPPRSASRCTAVTRS